MHRGTQATRRSILAGGGAALAAGAFALPVTLLAPGPAHAQHYSLDKLLAKNDLPDIWLGSEKAPVTIVEYASMTCGHCASFHAGTFKKLKTDYIDTGKVRMTVREFPFDPLAMAAFMLARCEGPAKRSAMIDHLFATQRTWAFSKKPLEALINVTRQAGVSQENFEKCLKDRTLYEKITAIRNAGEQTFKVTSTPTFFVNGTRLVGDQTIEAFAKIIDPIVASKK